MHIIGLFPYIQFLWHSVVLSIIGRVQKPVVINSHHLTRVQPGASLGGHTVGERQPRCMHFSGTTVTLGKKVRVRFCRWRSASANALACDAGENYSLTCITKCTFPYCCIVGCIVRHYKIRKAFLQVLGKAVRFCM